MVGRSFTEDTDILVIDDTPENRVAIEAALEGLGDELVTASSGPEALRYLLQRDFALIVLDVQMPTMNGIETARLIRQRERSRHVPIIFITAFDRDDDEVLEAYRLGAVDFLFKPIDPEILQAKASVFVELHRRAVEMARQTRLIRKHEQIVHERALAEQRILLKEEALRRRLAEQKEHASELADKNQQLEQARAALETSNDQLSVNDRRKNEFIAVLAHELRNPLAAIWYGLEMLDNQVDTATEEKARATMMRQCRHIVRLVEDLLEISRITSGKLTLRRAAVTPRTVIDDAVDLARPAIEGKAHSLTISCTSEPAWLDGDPVRLAQAIANLLSNAARYTPPGGHIELSAELQAPGSLIVRITDDGQGMSQDVLDRAFDMFAQGQAGGMGMGIGLTLVRELVALHGGTISAASEGLGRGSTFEIRLPTAEEPPVHPAQNADEPEPRDADFQHRAHLRVALIDDDDDLRPLLRILLEDEGHDVIEARNGIEGVDAILHDDFDIALVDLGLPDIDGFEVARRLRGEMGSQCPRLIAVSGYGRAQDRERSSLAGFDAHLCKPADVEKIRSVMNLHRPSPAEGEGKGRPHRLQ